MDGTTLAGIAIGIIVIIAIMALLTGKASGSDSAQPTIQLHPAQLKFMEEKEDKYCSGNTKGKGIRCIIDYMREASTEQVQQIFAEVPQFSDAYVSLSMDLYAQQVQWLSDQGIKLGAAEGAEQYEGFSSAFRAMLDYAMRMEKEGNKDMIEDIYGNVRCLNC